MSIALTVNDIPIGIEVPEVKRQVNVGPLAAALIREKGWWNGQSDPNGDTYCVWLAVDKVCMDMTGHSAVIMQVAQDLITALGVTDPTFPTSITPIFDWNDHQTAQTVIDFLDNAVLMVDLDA
jgi:hypothetical protein